MQRRHFDVLTPLVFSARLRRNGARTFVLLCFRLSLMRFGGYMKFFCVFLHKSLSISVNASLPVALVLGLLLVFLPSGIRAQGLSGMTGTVTDPSGAVVPDAKVTV